MKDRITQLFLQYLKSCNVSEKTLRYYKSDLALFTAWLVFKIKSLGADCENLQEALPFLTNKTAEEYKEFLIKNGNSVQTINRRLSTLRILSKFLLDTNLLSFNFAKNIKNISKAVMVPPLERAAAEFSNYLEAQKASFLTRKNYLADINQFLRFIEKQSKKDLQEITSKDIKRYLIIELASSPETTKDRKISSLKKFFSWAKEEKKTNINPVEDYLKDTAYLKPIEKSLSEITEPSINRKVFGNYPSYEGLKAKINAYLAGKPRLQKLVYHLLYTRPKWYKAYHSLAISRYLNFAILVIFATGLGFGIYQQLFAKPQTPIAYPSQPVPPKRYLSFQGRLTNQYQTPITTPTNIVFKLYDAATGGNTLWNSAGVACSVDPDEDGIFSILLGTTSGEGYTCTGISPIDSSVFTENAEVWLGIKVGSDPEATPRIQIATVAYALNAETLQGYPIDATGSATKNTVLTMNSGGEVVLAEVGPKIKSVSGNFSVQGEAVTIQANGGGVAGDITLSPASDGTVSILASGTTNDSLYIQNAQITSGALIHGYYGGTSTTVDLLKLGAGATESTKFLVESSGDTFIASGADLFIGGIGLNDNSSNSSGASLIGLYDDNMTYISGNTNVQSAIKQLDTAIGTLTGSAGGWTDDGTIVRLTTSSDRVGIGTTSVNSNTKVGILGNLAIGSQTYSDAQAPTNGLIVEGNVGIGTTAPTAKLDVAGDILVNNGGSIDTRAAGTLTIGGTTQTGLTVGRSGATTTINGSSVVINSLSGIIQGSSGTISAITGTANYVPRWSSSAPYLTSTSTIFDNGTNVGIGTTVPTKGKLNVLGSVAIGSTAYTETSGAAPTYGMIVEGNVGIGTTAPGYKLDVAGDIYSSGNIRANTDLYIAGTALSANTTTTSGASLVGLYDDAMTYISGNTNVQNAIKQLDTAIGSVSGSAGGWTDDGTIVRLTTSTDRVGIGTTSVNANTKLGVLGGVAIGSQSYSDAQAPTNGMIVEGNVGIGTTAPTAKLDVAGNILVNNGGSIDTRAAGTLTIGGTTQTGLTVGRSGATTSIVGSNITAGGIAYGASNTLTFTSAGTSGQPLLSGGSGAPTFGTLGLVYGGTNADLSGVAQGGLIYKGATALSGTGALTGILQGNGSSAPTAITGTANYVPRWSSSAPYLTSTSTIFDNGTNVGIGTTVPTKGKLNVLGSVAIGSTAYTETSGAAPTYGMIVEGNVGIGTTAPAKKLDIVASTTSSFRITRDTDSSMYFEIQTGDWGSGSGASIVAPSLRITDGTQTFIAFRNNGNVGIGTTAPTAKLDVAGDILVNNGGSIDTRAAGTLTIGGTTQTGLTVGRSGATTTINGSSVVINSLSGIIQGSSGTISAITGTANYVPRWSSSAPYLTSTSTIFDNGTNVGIGTTVPSAFKLEIGGSVGPSADNSYDLGSSSRRWANIYGTNIYGNITPTGFTQGSVIFAGAGGTLSQNNANFFWDNTNLRLGIGTNTPSVSIDSTGSLRLTAGTFQIGNAANVAYNRIGTNATNRGLSAASDLLINGKLEVDQAFFPDSGIYGSGGSLVVNFPNNDAWFSDEVWVDGKIGIGTTAPVNKLSVIGGVNIGSTSYNVTAPTNGLIVEGNVGIGTTAPASKFHLMWSDAGATGQRFSDAAIFENNGNAFLQLIGSAAGEKSINFAKPTNGADGAIKYNYSSVPNGFSFWTNGNNFRMAIDQNGNVGIGTTSPRNGLELAKLDSNYITSLRVGGITGGNLSVPLQSETSRHQILFSSWRDVVTNTVGAKIVAINKNVYQQNNALVQNTDLAFFTLGTTPTGTDNTSEVMRITSTGNVGIGTAGPATSLHIAGGDIELSDGTSGFRLHSRYQAAYDFFQLAPRTGGTIDWSKGITFVRSTGNVGIGTAGPGNKLGVTITTNDVIPSLGSNGGSFGLFKNDGGTPGNYGFIMGVLGNGNVFQQAQRIDGTAAAYNLLLNPNGGNVGIGTAGPGAKLSITTTGTELSGTAASATLKTMAGNLGTTAGNTLKLASFGFLSSNNSSLGIEALRTANGTDWTTTAIGLKMDVDNTSPVNNAQIWLTSTGNVGIGTASPSYKLDVNGDINLVANSSVGLRLNGIRITNNAGNRISMYYVGCSTAWGSNCDGNANGWPDYADATLSDQELKTVIGPITNSLEKILNLNGVYYRWNDKYLTTGLPVHGDVQIGLIAQEVQRYFPEIVFKEGPEDPYYHLDYEKLTAVIIEAIKDLNTKVNNQGNTVIQLASQSVSLAMLEKDLSLTSTGDLDIAQTQNGDYQVQNSQTGDIITRLSAFAETVIGKIRAGSISAYEITTNGFIAFQAQVDNLLVKTGLVSPSVQTAMISPLADEKDIVIRLGKSASGTGSDPVQGKLSIQNQNGEEVASINSEGDATFSGTLKSENLAVENNATISGDLTANNINTGEIRAEKLVVDQIVSPSGYNSGVTLEQIEELLRQAQADQNLLGQAEDWYNATSSAQIKNLAAETATLKNLFVTQSIAANSLSLSQSISLGTDMVIQSQLIDNKLANSIDTLTAPLSIQSLALAPVEIMAGKIRIETNGDVYIAGNLYVAGRVESTGLTVKTSADMTRTDLVRVEDEAGNLAAGISASGSAQFKELASDKIVIAGASVATDSATLQNGEINTNASAGSGILPAGQKEIAIVSPNIKSESLVYVTPTSDTKNYVLYVKAKEDGRMVVGFNRALDIDVYFNWWVIEAR